MTYLWVSLALTAVFAILYWVRNYKVADEITTWVRFGIRAVVWLGIMWFINWYFTPTIAFDHSGLYWELLFTLIYSSIDKNYEYEEPFGFLNLWAAGAAVLLGLAMVTTDICSGRWINTEKHRSLIEMSNDDYAMITSQDDIRINQDSLFNEGISPVSLEKMRTVSPDVAEALAESVMGQIPAFGSQYEIGDLSLQSITGSFDITDGLGKNYHLSFDDDFIYVAPLEFKGL